MHEHQLAEIRVDSHEYASLGSGVFEQRTIAWINPKFIGEEGIVTLIPQPGRQSAPGAQVDEKSHDSTTDTADSVSPAMTAWA